ncbi:MAG TPA: HDIG domain-containing protein, partial [Anaerolineales bacterium]|nr:HDIG domain-containing protein [Anaerolineales bacterium]
MGNLPARGRQMPRRIRMIQIILLLLVSIISYGALVLPLALRPTALPLQPGDVSPRDFQAQEPRDYISEVRTEELRDAAENAVPDVYAPPDPSIPRIQIEKLRAALQYITLVRNDEFATPEQKISDIASLGEVSLNSQTIEKIVGLPDSRWEGLDLEALSVLEQVMRGEIRDDDLQTVERTIPSLVSLALNEDQVGLVAELVTAFVIPNSIYSENLTATAREAARDAVEPFIVSYKAGETIIPNGDIITPVQFEALQVYGYIDEPNPWQEYAGAGALVLMLAVFVNLYFSRRKMQFLYDSRSLAVIALIFVLFIVSARAAIPYRTILPYAFPLPAMGLLIATLFGMEVGVIFSLMIALLVPYSLPNTMDLMPYYIISSLTGVMLLGTARRVWTFFRAGMAIALAGIAMLAAFRFPFTETDELGLISLGGAALFNGLASASIALLLQYFLAQSLGLTTALQLIEISRPDFPLLQLFLRNAPGTYQHSLQVANLAEQAAEQIGADALLTRVGALFHDVGKSTNPMFFIENQPQGQINTHEDMDPTEAAETIIAHVLDGVSLARKYRLPRRIDDFILEHHGTMITRYQYTHALAA